MGKDKEFKLRISEIDLEKLKQQAEDNGVTSSEWVRRLILMYEARKENAKHEGE